MNAHNVRAILRIHILFLSSFYHIALAISHVQQAGNNTVLHIVATVLHIVATALGSFSAVTLSI